MTHMTTKIPMSQTQLQEMANNIVDLAVIYDSTSNPDLAGWANKFMKEKVDRFDMTESEQVTLRNMVAELLAD